MSSQPATGTSLPLLRLSVPQYHAMRRTGILTEDDRVELLDGLLVWKMTKNPPHSLATELTRRALERALGSLALGEWWHVRSQEPITTPDSEPEPDVVVVAGGLRDYRAAHPSPADVALVVEVADESLRRDRKDKLAIYARAGIATYWIINLTDRHVEVFGAPSAEAYDSSAIYAAGDELPLVLDGQQAAIDVDALLP